MKQSCFLFLVVFFSLNSFFVKKTSGQLSGTYTIDASKAASSTNYRSLTAAVQDLNFGYRSDSGTANGSGISASVVFNFSDGTYMASQINIGAVSGTSVNKTITFQSASGDSTKVILLNTVDNESLINLDSTKYIIFKNLTLKKDTADFFYSSGAGHVVSFSKGASFITFQNCIIRGFLYGQEPLIANYGYGFIYNNITFQNNKLKYGLSGIKFQGTDLIIDSLSFENNIIDSVREFGIYLGYCQNYKITGNRITNLLDDHVACALNIQYCKGSQIISSNYIQLSSKAKTYGTNIGIALHGNVCKSEERGMVSNNMICGDGKNEMAGIYIGNLINFDIVHNSINLLGTNNGNHCLLLLFGDTGKFEHNRLLNNIFSIQGSGVAVYYMYNSFMGYDAFDYNNYYISSKALGIANDSLYYTFAQFKAHTGFDRHSTVADPKFKSSTDLHTSASALNNKAFPLDFIETDYDGNKRGCSPDIGADEVNFNKDAATIEIISPVNGSCGDSATPLIMVIENFGEEEIDSIPVTISITDGIAKAFSDTIKYGLKPCQKDTFIFRQTINTYNGVNIKVKVFTSYLGDEEPTNNAIEENIKINKASPTPDTVEYTICDSGIVTLFASSTGKSTNWYSTDTSRNPVYIGVDFITPMIFKDTIFYVSYSNDICEGKRSPAIIKVFHTPVAQFLVQDACFSTAIQLQNNTVDKDSIISYHWDFGDGDSSFLENPLHIYDSIGQYKVVLKASSSFGCTDTFSQLITVFPKPIAKFITEDICLSETAYFTDTSTMAADYFWNFGDSSISHLQSPIHKYFSAGTYMVKLVVKNTLGCTDTFTKEIIVSDMPKAIFSVNDICFTENVELADSSKGATERVWKFGDDSNTDEQNPTHYYGSAGTYNIWLIVSNKAGCKDSVMHTITVDSTCVWPGDANADKIVDNKDILAIGLAYSDTGSNRTDTSTFWKGNIVNNWSSNFSSGANYKHTDSDGNGIVSAADTMAVSINYTKTHAKKQSANRGKNTDPVFKIEIQNDSLKAGDTLLAYIILGENALPAKDVYGLAFNLNYNRDLFSSAVVSYANSWLGNNIIGYSHYSNQIDLAITRTDHINKTGYGKLATVKLIMKKDVPIDVKQIKLEITDNIIISADEQIIPVKLEDDSVRYYKLPNSIYSKSKSEQAQIMVFPNPFTDQTIVEYNLIQAGKVNIVLYDINGRAQILMPSTLLPSGKHHFTLDANEHKMSSGVYLIKVEIDGIASKRKIIRLK